jgi:hypothetical protein
VRDGGRLATTFDVVDNELEQSADDEIRQSGCGATRRRTTWHWFDVARPAVARRQARAVARVLLFVDQNLTYNGHYI